MNENYYKEYYNTKKHLYKIRYEEQKIERKKKKNYLNLSVVKKNIIKIKF
jgi:hypothetical protein